MNSIRFGNSQITYKIRRTKRTTTQIVVDNFGVKILTSEQKSQKQIQDLVKKHSKWIYKKKNRFKDLNNYEISYEAGSRLPYLGRNYMLQVIISKDREAFSFKNGRFIVKLRKFRKSKIKEFYTDWLKQKSPAVLKKQVSKFTKKLGIHTPKIHIKKQKNRWGSVTKKGTINFNQNLVKAPLKIIDYVVAHEVCHFKIPNHSSKYWELVYSIMPDYEKRNDWLRINWKLINS